MTHTPPSPHTHHAPADDPSATPSGALSGTLSGTLSGATQAPDHGETTSKEPPACAPGSILGAPARVERWADPRISAWQDLQFGLFLHWGVYSMFEGRYQGKDQTTGYPEQIKAWMNISDADYLAHAGRMSAEHFDPAAICDMAQQAGMTYVMVTTKHHDGFAMWDTATTDFNVVTQTPFGRDPLRMLSDECAKRGLKLAFYFSIIDWTQHEAEPWENLNPIPEQMMPYIHEQLRELLTNYGPIYELWFDMGQPTDEQSARLAQWVHHYQPDTTVVNSRVWNNKGDFEVGGDNAVPTTFNHGPWESILSLFPACWSYCSTAQADRSENQILPKAAWAINGLVTVISGGGQFAFNLGPKGDGTIDPFDREVMGHIGQWMRRHPTAISGAHATYFPIDPSMRVTTAGNALYLFPARWCEGETLTLPGLANVVTSVSIDGPVIVDGPGTVSSPGSADGSPTLADAPTSAETPTPGSSPLSGGAHGGGASTHYGAGVDDEATRGEATLSLPFTREGLDLTITMRGPQPDPLQPVIRVDLDGEPTMVPSHAAELRQGKAVVSGDQIVGLLSPNGSGGYNAYDMYVVDRDGESCGGQMEQPEPCHDGHPQHVLSLEYEFAAPPAPGTLYALSVGQERVIVTGGELLAGPVLVGEAPLAADVTLVGGAAPLGETLLAEGAAPVSDLLGANTAVRIRLEYAQPDYFADVVDAQPSRVTIRRIPADAPSAPVFSAQPTNVEASVGSQAVFSAVATGFPTPTYQWYMCRPGAQSSEADATPLEGEVFAALTLPAVMPCDQEATFFLETTNSAGTCRSETVTLSVTEARAASSVTSCHSLGAPDREDAAHTEPTVFQPVTAEGWWHADVGEEISLGQVRVWNRTTEHPHARMADEAVSDIDIIVSRDELGRVRSVESLRGREDVIIVRIPGIVGCPSVVDFHGEKVRYVAVAHPDGQSVTIGAMELSTHEERRVAPSISAIDYQTVNEAVTSSGDGSHRTITTPPGTMFRLSVTAEGNPAPQIAWMTRRSAADAWADCDHTDEHMTISISADDCGRQFMATAVNTWGRVQSGIINFSVCTT